MLLELVATGGVRCVIRVCADLTGARTRGMHTPALLRGQQSKGSIGHLLTIPACSALSFLDFSAWGPALPLTDYRCVPTCLPAASVPSCPCTLSQSCCQSSQVSPALFCIKSTVSSFTFSAFWCCHPPCHVQPVEMPTKHTDCTGTCFTDTQRSQGTTQAGSDQSATELGPAPSYPVPSQLCLPSVQSGAAGSAAGVAGGTWTCHLQLLGHKPCGKDYIVYLLLAPPGKKFP